MMPKLAELSDATGLLKFTWFSTLKNSKRNSRDLHESDLPDGRYRMRRIATCTSTCFSCAKGEMEVMLDGNWTRLGPGSCAYMASNDPLGAIFRYAGSPCV
jgi:hypothetical protein